MKLSESSEDYLEAIAELIAVEGHAHAHTKAIAEKMHVKMPSVTGALRQLASMNYVIYNSHCPVRLTPAGEKIAKEIMRRHGILQKFFSEIFCLPVEKAAEVACKIEHIVDSDTVERFVIFGDALNNRSDAKSLLTYLTEAMHVRSSDRDTKLCVLSEIPIGESAVMKIFGRNLPLEDRPDIPLGSLLTLESISLDKTFFKVRLDENTLSLPGKIAENLWVEPLQS